MKEILETKVNELSLLIDSMHSYDPMLDYILGQYDICVKLLSICNNIIE